MLVLIIPTLVGLIVAHRAYENSKVTEASVAYWLPTNYVLVDQVNYVESDQLIQISSRNVFLSLADTNQVQIRVGAWGTYYYCQGVFLDYPKKVAVYRDLRPDRVTWGKEIVNLDTSKAGTVTINMKRSWVLIAVNFFMYGGLTYIGQFLIVLLVMGFWYLVVEKIWDWILRHITPEEPETYSGGDDWN